MEALMGLYSGKLTANPPKVILPVYCPIWPLETIKKGGLEHVIDVFDLYWKPDLGSGKNLVLVLHM